LRQLRLALLFLTKWHRDSLFLTFLFYQNFEYRQSSTLYGTLLEEQNNGLYNERS